MRRYTALPDSASGWCFWSSFVTLVTVIGVILAGAAVGAARAEDVAGVLLKVVQFGFIAVVAAFLFGIACSRIEEIRRRNHRG